MPELVEHLFRRQAAQLVAMLTRILGPARLELAEDAMQETLLLEEQDRARWDRGLLVEGMRQLARSAAGDELSPYHLEAGIAACHAVAPTYAATDWPRILGYYDELLAVRPTPVVALNRAVALGMAHVPEAGAAEIERIRTLPGLGRYYLLHAAAGEFARRCGDQHAALAHYRRTETCGMTGPERRFLARKIAELP